MSNDSIRSHLVLQACCANCGGQLVFSYEAPKRSMSMPYEDDRITGACKVEARFAVHPCAKCYGEALRPIQALREALGPLSAGVKP